MAEQHIVRDLLRDYLVYAPLGAAVVAAEEIPRLAEHYERLERQLNAAGTIGRFAVAQATRRLSARTPADSVAVTGRAQLPVVKAREKDEPAGGEERPAAPSARRGPAGPSAGAVRTGPVGQSVIEPDAGLARGGDLPIPGYDTLAASQVVERLASLTASELESVRHHESATRRRRTVLHRIAQLNAEHNGGTA